MTKPQIKEYNCETQREIIRDATDVEIAQIELDAIEYEARKVAEAEAKAAEEAAKQQAFNDAVAAAVAAALAAQQTPASTSEPTP